MSTNDAGLGDFLEYAKECIDWARSARSLNERKIFVQMAQTWLMAADRRNASKAAEGQDGAANTLDGSGPNTTDGGGRAIDGL